MTAAPTMPEVEDYRVKNAREGKAIYVPGKSVNETRANLGFPPLDDDPVVVANELISFVQTEIGEISDMANEVQYIMGTLSRTIETLRKGVGDFMNDGEVESILQLAHSYAKNAADKECDTLIMKIMRLDRVLAGASQ